MKAVFLFVEKCPNYDQAFYTLDRLIDAEIRSLDSYILAGVWNLFTAPQFSTNERLEAALLSLLTGFEGSAVAITSEEVPRLLLNEQIYVVQFNSLNRHLAFDLHHRLSSRSDYCGLIEVHPDFPLHRIVFSGYGPLLKVEQQRVLLLYTGADNEEYAQEKRKWLLANYMRLGINSDIYDTDVRFSLLDVRTWPQKEFDVQRATRVLNEEWETLCEHVLYKLFDIAPDAASELQTAALKLRQVELFSAECAQMAVSFRRCLEKVADVLVPPQSGGEKDKYKARLVKYVHSRLADHKHYADYVEAELAEIGTRIEKLYNMGNKGVHEDWYRQAFVTVALRLVILLNDLLSPVAPAKAMALLEPDLFNKVIGKAQPGFSS